jgi:type I restriction enzyme S subunit
MFATSPALRTTRPAFSWSLRHACTGQLVPQDPKDEPAAELLKRIAAERAARARQAAASKHPAA